MRALTVEGVTCLNKFLITNLLLISVILVISSAGAEIPTMKANETTLYYTFDNIDGLTVYDESDNNLDGINIYSTSIPFKINSGLSFDGVDDRLGFTDYNILEFNQTRQFTISFWINTTDITNNVNEGAIFTKLIYEHGVDAGYLITLNQDDINVHLSIWNETSASLVHQNLTLKTNNTLNEVSHVTVQFDGLTGRLYGYKNAVLVINQSLGSSSVNGYFPSSYGGFISRKNEVGTNTFSKFNIDELVIHDRILTASEVSIIYNSGEGISLLENINFNIFVQNETDRQLLNKTTELEVLLNNNQSVKTVSSNGEINNYFSPNEINNNSLDVFEFRLKSEDYNSRSYFKSINITECNPECQFDLYVYLPTEDDTEQQRIRIVDTSSENVEDAIVRMQRQYIPGGWITVEEAKTNSEGLTDVFIFADENIFYRFIVIYEETVLFTSTSTNFIPNLDEIYEITVNTELGETGGGAQGVNSVLEYNETIEGFFYRWIDPTNTVNKGRIQVVATNISNGVETISCDNETTGSTGQLYCYITPINDTEFHARGYVYYGDSPIKIDDLIKIFGVTKIPDKTLQLLFAFFVFTIIVLLTLDRGLLFAGLSGFGSLLVLNLLRIINMPTMVISSFIGLLFILFVKWRKNK